MSFEPTSGLPKYRNKLVTGWLETVELPEWRIQGLTAKLDTGARSSALHVEALRHEGDGWVRFDVVLEPAEVQRRHVHARIVRESRVRSSTGHFTQRVFVRTTLRLGSLEREIELSLVDREQMQYRMLVGRTSLKGVLVNPSRRHLLVR
jgi:hypothetical protein